MNYIYSFYTELPIFQQIIILVFIGSLFLQLFYYLFFYSRVWTFGKKKPRAADEDFPLSVVICAKNEANNLKGFLDKVLTQDYPEYQVVVVNDSSEDHSNAVLNAYKEKYKHLYVTFLENNKQFSHGKKLALTIGIKAAKYEHIVFTDADCRPDTDQWLRSMAAGYRENTQIVLGYGGYLKRRGFLNKLIRFDTLFIAVQYMSFAKAGMPYMAVGRNMSYTQSVYNSVKGFSSHYHILSGDDDLFVNQTATRKNTNVVSDSDSIVRSVPKQTMGQYIHQKRRHLSTGKYYKFAHKLFLSLELISRFLFYLTFALLLIISVVPKIVLALFAGRLLIQMGTIYKAGRVFDEKDLPLYSLFFDIFIPLLNIWTIFSKYFIKNKITHKW